MTTSSSVRSWSVGAFAGPLLFLLSLGYFAVLAPYGLDLADEGHLVHQIYRTYLGQLPYVDFHSGYTPGVYYWNAALFTWFGVNLVVLRLSLALFNALTVGCLFWLARHLGAGRLAAMTAGLLYLGLVPFHDGHFAPFNIPYPAWYVTPFWLLSVMCVVRWWEGGRGGLWLIAGLCAGVVFGFKQNSGLLNLAALLMTMGLLEQPLPGQGSSLGAMRRWLCRCERLVRWMMPIGGAIGMVLMMGRSAGAHEVYVFALPLAIVVGWHVFVPAARVARPLPAFTLWRHLLLLVAGFAAVTVPWAVYFWIRLGPRLFLRSILYIGAGYEQFYFIGYPGLGEWGVAIAAGLGLVLLVSVMMARGWLPARFVGGVIVVGIGVSAFWVLRHPPRMIEGFQKSVVMRVEDVSFALILCLEWLAIAVHAVQTWPRGRAHVPAREGGSAVAIAAEPRSGGVFVIVLLAAILMHAQLYPRSDFMHLVYAAPGVLILAARMLNWLATRWAIGMARTQHGRRAVRALVVAPIYALVIILLAPALTRIEYLLRGAWEGDTSAVVRLDTPHAPLVIEPAAGRLFLGLSSTIHYLQAHSLPSDFVFTFPCLDMLSFLADRRDPSRHGYYYPGSPGHAVEAEVIDALRTHAPRYIVALHDHALFFVAAPLYYFNLRQYVSQHYRFVRRIGMFDILQADGIDSAGADAREEGAVADLADDTRPQNELAESLGLWRRELQHRRSRVARRVDAKLEALPAPEIGALAETITALDPRAQRTVAFLIRRSRSAAGAAALATALESLAPSGLRDLFLRTIAEVGDLRSVAPLLRVLRTAEFAELGNITGDLFTIASRSWIENYWYAPPQRPELPVIEAALTDEQIVRWMDNPWEVLTLRSFAIRMAARRHSRTFIPFLVRLLGDGNEPAQLRSDAAHSLVELGFGAQVLRPIGALLRQTDLVPAVLIAALYPQAPDVGREVLAESMAAKGAAERATAFWVAAAAHDAELADYLRAGLSDPLPEVRMAAIWGLGNIGDATALADLQRTLHDGNEDVEAFAERAIQRIAVGDAEPARRPN